MTQTQAGAISGCLSAPRVRRYVNAVLPAAGTATLISALELYRWNVEVCAALMVPIHLCEVTVRNAADEALTAVYGPQWPWSPGLRQALPNPSKPHYNPRRDLIATAGAQPTTGKVIPELKLAFWSHLFTYRHDNRLWRPLLHQVLPHADQGRAAAAIRGEIRLAIEQMRELRNRIAHHEPIYGRALPDDLTCMRTLVGYRSSDMLAWLDHVETVTALITRRPATR